MSDATKRALAAGLSKSLGGLGYSLTELLTGGKKHYRTPQRFFSHSDKTVKTNIKNNKNPITSWLDGIKPYAYNYKPGYEDGGTVRHIGVMAQDMAKSDVGSKMVVKFPNGKLGLDLSPKKAIPMILAALANLNERVK